ncbi:MAG: type I restriction enzyme HsdR N-terminal domain-containing protein [Cytophagales bacterium]
MLVLNLPQFDYRIVQKKGVIYIFDTVRKIELKLTPEEWVRQHYINYLVDHLHYPKSLIRSELGLHYHKKAKRADIIVYSGQDAKPLILVECKAPFIKITDRTLQQASLYCSQLKPTYLVLTNGLQHFHYKIGNEVEAIANLPSYDQ